MFCDRFFDRVFFAAKAFGTGCKRMILRCRGTSRLALLELVFSGGVFTVGNDDGDGGDVEAFSSIFRSASDRASASDPLARNRCGDASTGGS